ncbi:MAG: DNA replication and repair protein RecF [Bacteroidales bacterium]|nr:DNA replication and repair protein RecF [Bacteroidales bacterium]
MAILKKIVIQDFRNIRLQELTFSPNINCISGGNGEGKTNLLDAIWYLSMTKSAFSTTDRFNFRHGTSAFALSGTYDMPGGTVSRFSIRVQDGGQKAVRRDDKPYGRISEHIGVLPIVMVSPADIAMVSESGEERRKFVNSVLSQMEQPYLADVQQYNRLLLQRNKLLKAGVWDEELLSTFDERLSALARPVFERRKAFCGQLVPVVQQYYAEISGGREQVGIDYRSDLQKGSLRDILCENRDRDRVCKFTTAGVQRDDFLFTMDGHPIRRCGSQGQQKSFLVALKFAQYEVMKAACGYPPIMLLDDLFDKLDMSRVGNLLRLVADKEFGQIFLSDSNKVRTESIVDTLTADRSYFETAGGVFTPVNE